MKRFKNILCVIEPGEACKPALERAVTLAENNQASLKIVVVIEDITSGISMPDDDPYIDDLQNAMAIVQERRLEPLVEPFRKRVDIQTEILKGVPFIEITHEVLRNEHDLVIKMPETEHWIERLFGSDDMHLLRKCPCPVWLIKAGEPKPYRRILAAVDVTEGDSPEEQKARQSLNIQILEMASSLALAEFAELHIVHAWNMPGESLMHGAFMNIPEDKIISYVEQVRRQHKQALEVLLRKVVDKPGQDALEYLKPQMHLVKGSARKEIPILVKQLATDLVVMGTIARTGVPGIFMGNTAESILNQIDCSVLAIKPPGFISPMKVPN